MVVVYFRFALVICRKTRNLFSAIFDRRQNIIFSVFLFIFTTIEFSQRIPFVRTTEIPDGQKRERIPPLGRANKTSFSRQSVSIAKPYRWQMNRRVHCILVISLSPYPNRRRLSGFFVFFYCSVKYIQISSARGQKSFKNRVLIHLDSKTNSIFGTQTSRLINKAIAVKIDIYIYIYYVKLVTSRLKNIRLDISRSDTENI